MTPLQIELQAIEQLDKLWREGKGESEEADAIRSAGDANWKLLSDDERQQARDYSERLNSEASK